VWGAGTDGCPSSRSCINGNIVPVETENGLIEVQVAVIYV